MDNCCESVMTVYCICCNVEDVRPVIVADLQQFVVRLTPAQSTQSRVRHSFQRAPERLMSDAADVQHGPSRRPHASLDGVRVRRLAAHSAHVPRQYGRRRRLRRAGAGSLVGVKPVDDDRRRRTQSADEHLLMGRREADVVCAQREVPAQVPFGARTSRLGRPMIPALAVPRSPPVAVGRGGRARTGLGMRERVATRPEADCFRPGGPVGGVLGGLEAVDGGRGRTVAGGQRRFGGVASFTQR